MIGQDSKGKGVKEKGREKGVKKKGSHLFIVPAIHSSQAHL